MSFSVIRMAKFKMHDVKGLQIHNQREKESHTNPDIQRERERENYDLHNEEKINYRERIDEIIKENVETTRAIRKDAVVQCEFVCTSDKKFFEGLSQEEQERFFKESYEFLKERYGEQNVVHATVHMDEKTPHMHVGVVPIRDGRLSAKRIFDRKELRSLQTDYNKHLREKGFDLKRGEPSDRKHIETNRFKAEQARQKLDRVSQDLTQAQSRLKGLTGAFKTIQERHKVIDEIPVKEKGLISKDRVEVAKEDWEHVKREAMRAPVYKVQGEQLADTVESLAERVEEIPRYHDRVVELSRRVNQLENFIERIEGAVDRLGLREEIKQELDREDDREQEIDRTKEIDRGRERELER